MAKKVLIFILALSFFGPTFQPGLFIKDAQAAVTISNLDIPDNGENLEFTTLAYQVKFINGSTPILPANKININFTGGFSFDSGWTIELDGRVAGEDSNGQLNVSKVGGKITLRLQDPNDSIGANNQINVLVIGIKNPAAGTYDVNVDVDGLSQLTEKITVIPSNGAVGPDEDGVGPSIGSGDSSVFPGLRSCHGKIWNRIGCWIKQVLTYVPKYLVSLGIGAVKLIIGAVIGGFITLASELVKLTAGLSFGGVTAARIGYDISLALTNIGFVIFIIVIAFATILKKESYAIKKALPRLIIIALVMNFSWFLATTLIDISNRLADGLMAAVSAVSHMPTTSFINQIGNLGTFFTSQFEGANMDSILPDSLFFLPGLEFLLQLFKGLLQVVMQAVFGLVGFFALIATAVMLLIRYIHITFLLILMPLALLLNIFPNLEIGGQGGAWKKWTSEFTKWLIFYPIVMFFLAIGFATGTLISDGTMQVNPLQRLNPLLAFVNILVVAGIMIGGLIAAQKMGINGANFANNLASKTMRRMPANFAALGRIGRRRGGAGAAVPDGDGAGPAGSPAGRLNFPGFQAQQVLPTDTVADASSGQPPLQPSLGSATGPTVTPQPDVSTTAPRMSFGEKAAMAARLVTIGPTKKGDVKKLYNLAKEPVKKGFGKFMAYSAGGPSTMEIMKSGVKEMIGKNNIFGGLMPGKTDDLKKAEEKLQNLRDKRDKLAEKEANKDKELYETLDKLEKDNQADPNKKMRGDVRKYHEDKRDKFNSDDYKRRMAERIDKDIKDVKGAIEKTKKEIKKFGGKHEDIPEDFA